MKYFHGELFGRKKTISRCGTKKSIIGMRLQAGYSGVRVSGYHNETTNKDIFIIYVTIGYVNRGQAKELARIEGDTIKLGNGETCNIFC